VNFELAAAMLVCGLGSGDRRASSTQYASAPSLHHLLTATAPIGRPTRMSQEQV
jgi:hypothetical protein